MKKEYRKPICSVLESEEVVCTSNELFTIAGNYSGQAAEWDDKWN